MENQMKRTWNDMDAGGSLGFSVEGLLVVNRGSKKELKTYWNLLWFGDEHGAAAGIHFPMPYNASLRFRSSGLVFRPSGFSVEGLAFWDLGLGFGV